jgi:hypothetical protein
VSKTLCTNTLKSILQNKDEIQEIFAEALGQEEARIFMAFLENNI